MEVLKRGLVIFFLLGAGLLEEGTQEGTALLSSLPVHNIFLTINAGEAYARGSLHFNALRSRDYDIELAQFFFTLAEKVDPHYPYLQHQLARIAFLNGDFKKALFHIDKEIEMCGAKHANAFYVRGLIRGFAGDYERAARDYERYLSSDPKNWAAINDYAWVLLKSGRPREAVVATAGGLSFHPGNPWLLNSNAVALYEIGLIEPALEQARKALIESRVVSAREWLTAYPGNDPRVAHDGISALQGSIRRNVHTLLLAKKKDALQ